jgi:hypothetical protein
LGIRFGNLLLVLDTAVVVLFKNTGSSVEKVFAPSIQRG